MSRLRSEIRNCRDQEQRLIKLYMEGEIGDYIRTHSGPVKDMRERYQEEFRQLNEQQSQQMDLEKAEAQIKAFCGKASKDLGQLDFDGKRAAFAMLQVNVIATHGQVVVK